MGDAEFIMRINAIGTVNVNDGFYPIAGEGFAIVNVASMAAYMLPKSSFRQDNSSTRSRMKTCS